MLVNGEMKQKSVVLGSCEDNDHYGRTESDHVCM